MPSLWPNPLPMSSACRGKSDICFPSIIAAQNGKIGDKSTIFKILLQSNQIFGPRRRFRIFSNISENLSFRMLAFLYFKLTIAFLNTTLYSYGTLPIGVAQLKLSNTENS